jgi:signal peptidase I
MLEKTFKILANVILAGLVMLGIFVVFSFVPFPGNFKIFTVQSGSMEPAIGTGSLIFVKPSGEYQAGDVVTRKTTDPKITVTHRVIEKKEEAGEKFFLTKGDANDAPDGEKVLPGNIIGKMIFRIPLIGYAVNYAKTTQGLILLIIVPSVIIIYDELNKIKEEIRKKMRRGEGV